VTRSLLISGFLLAMAGPSLGQTAEGGPLAGMESYVAAAMERWDVPGLALAVVEDGETVLARGWGVCEVGTDRKVTKDTLFDIASCSKAFVAAAVGVLVEEGEVRWDDPVTTHLPDLEFSDPYLTEHVTLRDMLAHRTGLQRCDLLEDRGDFTPAEILRRVRNIPAAAELRARLTYSNPMYTALGQVVTNVAEVPWEAFVSERILEPLGMRSTFPAPAEIPRDRLALRHWRSDAGVVARPPDDRAPYSTVDDMTRWLRMQLDGGTFAGRRILASETIGEMHALHTSVPVRSRHPENPYAAHFYGSGLGWFVQDYRGHELVLHGGSWGAMVGLLPDEGLGVVVLSNLDLQSLPGLLMYDVFDAYLLGPETTWDPAKWDSTWLANEPPGHAFAPRDAARAELDAARKVGTHPTLPFEAYAGAFDSRLYGTIIVVRVGERLTLTVGRHSTELSHWQVDSFYARAPTRLTYDWLLTFAVSEGGAVTAVTIHHVGWDADERDQVFDRLR